MKNILIQILLIFTCSIYAQPSYSECYISKKRGFLIRQKNVLLKISDTTYLLERYPSGMGIFWGVTKDTLKLAENKLVSDSLQIEFKNTKKYKIITKKSKKNYRFKILDKSNPDILYTRNLVFREEIKYKIKDKELASEFVKKTNNLITKLNHEEFKIKVEAIVKSIE